LRELISQRICKTKRFYSFWVFFIDWYTRFCGGGYPRSSSFYT